MLDFALLDPVAEGLLQVVDTRGATNFSPAAASTSGVVEQPNLSSNSV